jgi:hypothetical protein
VIAAYDGDRIMSIFIDDNQTSSAAKCGLRINWAVRNVINPALKAQYPITGYEVKTSRRHRHERNQGSPYRRARRKRFGLDRQGCKSCGETDVLPQRLPDLAYCRCVQQAKRRGQIRRRPSASDVGNIQVDGHK